MGKKYYITGIVFLLLIVFILSVIFDIAGIGKGNTPIDVKIAEGSGADGVAASLKAAGAINSKIAFKIYSRLTGEHLYQKGTHSISTSMSYGEIIDQLEKLPNVRAKTVLIPEGFEFRQIVKLLEDEGLINREEFIRAANNEEFDYSFVKGIPMRENRLEGYLYPDTYVFSEDMTEYDIINTMIENFEKNVIKVYDAAQTQTSLDDIIKLASVIEREAANDDERKLVSSVFVNRINTGMKLESCATVQYLLKERKEILSTEDTQIDSPYNTYKYAGLPVGPIAAPGIKSIEAAIYPEQTNYLYFMASGDGTYSLFAETYEQHLENQQKIQGSKE